MRFIVLVKFKERPTKEMIAEDFKQNEQDVADLGLRIIDAYWTLGRHDAVVVMEAPDENAAMRILIRRKNTVDLETMVAIPSKDAIKLVE